MKNIELKNCPNCNKRIGTHDIECPYCKYIDDPKYKKHNEKMKKQKKKTKKKKQKNIYKILLLIPIISYLTYLLFNINSLIIIVSLIILNVLCLFTKKIISLYIMIIEIIILVFKFITNFYEMTLVDNYTDLKTQIIKIISGIIFIIIPKGIYILKKVKRKNI